MKDIFDQLLEEYLQAGPVSAEDHAGAQAFVDFIHKALDRDPVTAYLVGENALIRESGGRLTIPGRNMEDLTSSIPPQFPIGPSFRQREPVAWKHAVSIGPPQ